MKNVNVQDTVYAEDMYAYTERERYIPRKADAEGKESERESKLESLRAVIFVLSTFLSSQILWLL